MRRVVQARLGLRVRREKQVRLGLRVRLVIQARPGLRVQPAQPAKLARERLYRMHRGFRFL
ncbi:hypothetical protein D3C75_1277780 [compost metagenome]